MHDILDDKLQGITQPPRHSNNGLWIFTSITLGVLTAISVSYIFYQNQRIRDLNNLKVEYLQRIETITRKNSPDPTTQPINSTPNISSFSQSTNRAGWMKYRNESLGVSFEYPVELVDLKDLSQTNQMGAVRSITLISKKDRDASGRLIEILRVDNVFSPQTYGDISTPDSVESEKYSVQGKKYDALNYAMGEGGPCGGGSINTSAIRLKENLTIYKISISQQKNKDQDTCEGDSYDIYNTSSSTLKLVDNIIGTVEF